eukprot:scaffold129733_cov69-Phaeocystis_antarctica.AAC.13
MEARVRVRRVSIETDRAWHGPRFAAATFSVGVVCSRLCSSVLQYLCGATVRGAVYAYGARAPVSPGRATLRLTGTFGAQEAGYAVPRMYCIAHDAAAHGVRVNTVQCSLTSLSRDLTTSGDFEGLPASFEATASNPAAASRLTGDAAAPSARIVATPSSIRTKLFRRRRTRVVQQASQLQDGGV